MKILNNLLTKNEVTLPTTIGPGNWFTSKEHYLEFCAAFQKFLNEGGVAGPEHFLLYAILRNRDWKKGWTYPLNPGKQVEHEYKKKAAFAYITHAWYETRLLHPFDGTITTEMLIAIRAHLKEIQES